MLGFLRGFLKLAHPCCLFMGIAVVGAAIWLVSILNSTGALGEDILLPSKNAISRAKVWAAVPKTAMEGKVLERGIKYTGECGYTKKNPSKSNVTLGACDVSGSGPDCSSAASVIFEKATVQQMPARRLGYGTTVSRCADAYQPWIKVALPNIGVRCAYRFGVQKIADVDGSDAGNSIMRHIFDEHTVGSAIALWGAASPLAKDDDTCVVGFSDPHLIIISASKKAETEKRTIVLMVCALGCLAVVFFSFGALAVLPASACEHPRTNEPAD